MVNSKDILILVILVTVYSVTLLFAGMQIERAYVNHLMPNVLAAELVEGWKMGEQAGEAKVLRDQLQGVRCQPIKIEVSHGS